MDGELRVRQHAAPPIPISTLVRAPLWRGSRAHEAGRGRAAQLRIHRGYVHWTPASKEGMCWLEATGMSKISAGPRGGVRAKVYMSLAHSL